MSRLVAVAVAALLSTTGLVHADGPSPNQAVSLDLGTTTGVAYYTPEASGYHVVVTLATSTSQEVTRFEAMLGAEQSMIVSLPGTSTFGGRRVELIRRGDRLVVMRDRVTPGS